MLGTGDRLKILRVIALHGPNRLHRKRLNKQRVLAEVFLATSPSRIPQPHIDRRRGKEGKAISRLIMIGAGLVGYGSVDLMNQVRIPGTPQGYGLRKRCNGSIHVDAVKSLRPISIARQRQLDRKSVV